MLIKEKSLKEKKRRGEKRQPGRRQEILWAYNKDGVSKNDDAEDSRVVGFKLYSSCDFARASPINGKSNNKGILPVGGARRHDRAAATAAAGQNRTRWDKTGQYAR